MVIGATTMRSARHVFVAAIGCVALAASAAAASRARAQALAAESRAPTPLEVALAEFACGPQAAGTTDDAHYQCINAGIDELRAQFGYDLSRLTAAHRRKIDKACGKLREAGGHDAYVACVSGELATMRTKKAAPEAAASDAAEPAPDASAPPADAPPPPPASSPWMVWLAGFLGVGVLAGAGGVVALRVKAARHRCKTCGAKVPPTSDLCPDCRKQAAEALRHAAAERADRERAVTDEKRRLEEAEQQRARELAEAQMRHEQEEQRQRERLEEEGRQREEEKRRHASERQGARGSSAAGEEVFDPYAILGVAHDAGQDAVAAAYEEARLKYDPTSVSHLGDEVQSYYKAKAAAVERAYQMIAGA